MINIDSSAFKRYSAVVLIMFFAIPGLLLISYMLFVRGFLPSHITTPWVVPAAVIFGIAIFSIALPTISVGARASGKPMQLLLIPLSPLFGAALGAAFVGSPLLYLLHVASNPNPAVTLETVKHLSALPSRRSTCGRSVTFAGDASIFRRRICRVSETTFRALKVGDTLELHGTASQFGMLVTSYKMPAEG